VLDVANYLHQRYGQLDEQDRTSEDGMSVTSITLEVGPPLPALQRRPHSM
jgi:hypothetical protein